MSIYFDSENTRYKQHTNTHTNPLTHTQTHTPKHIHNHTHAHTQKHTHTTSYKDQAVIRNVIQNIENQLSHVKSRRLRSIFRWIIDSDGLDSPLLCQDYSRSEMIISDEKFAH